MRFANLSIVLSIILALKPIHAQDQQQQDGNNNLTILQALNNTNSSPALKFVEFLQSSPDYQSILDILNDPSSNVTLFVPSDQVYYEATGQQPPTPAPPPVGNTTTDTNSTSSVNATTSSTTAAVGGATGASSTAPASASSASSSSAGGLSGFLSSIIAGASSSSVGQPAQPTAAPATTGVAQNNPGASGFYAKNMARYVKIPNAQIVSPYDHFATSAASQRQPSLVMRALSVDPQQSNDSDWESVTTDAPFVEQFSFTDIFNYHLVNESVQLNDTQNATIIFNTLLTNSSVDKLGFGLPLLLQQAQQDEGQDQGQNQNQTQGQGQGQNQSQVLWHNLQQQVDGTSNSTNSSANWTVGSSPGNSANIRLNETIKASNGMVYVIDKILVPPVSPTDSLNAIQNASFFEWLLTKSAENSTLDNTSNITMFVPTNDALQNLNFTDLNNETLQGALKAHIVPGVYYTTNLTSESTTVESVGGTNITLTNSDPTSNSSVTVNNAHVVQGNILLNNGVMHLIDSILDFPSVGNDNGNNTGSENGTDNGNSTDAGPFPAPQTSAESMALTIAMPMTGSAFAFFLCSTYVYFFYL
ncbi:hypothetical protein [Parasitella parasitica]|uniref:FAS1 domain-containing protein n=1 Tax=Parasitella parasitica TaxID=35722 RepID=A0A0B7N4A3_9FUNG|nr:hypothetical protein [Parasitella parasitica]